MQFLKFCKDSYLQGVYKRPPFKLGIDIKIAKLSDCDIIFHKIVNAQQRNHKAYSKFEYPVNKL